MKTGFRFLVLLGLCAVALHARQSLQAGAEQLASNRNLLSYVLGPDDQIVIRVSDVEELSDKPIRIGMDGYIRLPLIGRVRAGGLNVEQLEAELSERLKVYVRQPDAAVTVTEFRSQPVSVIGSVRNPGVHQLQGYRTLVDVLSLAGGLADDAGPGVKISRRLEWGVIPLAGAVETAGFSVAEVKLQAIVNANNPDHNIVIRPHDVISVPKAELVYVAGQVMRSGGFVLNGRESISILQALALAGGPDRSASPQNARILRVVPGGSSRLEIPVNVKEILANKTEDVALKPDDILFIPSSVPKQAALRALEAAIQTGTGLAIWRR